MGLLINDLISIIRYKFGEIPELPRFNEDVNQRFQDWLVHQKEKDWTLVTDKQREFLNVIKNHIATGPIMELDDFQIFPSPANATSSKPANSSETSSNALLVDSSDTCATSRPSGVTSHTKSSSTNLSTPLLTPRKRASIAVTSPLTQRERPGSQAHLRQSLLQRRPRLLRGLHQTKKRQGSLQVPRVLLMRLISRFPQRTLEQSRGMRNMLKVLLNG